MKVQVVVLSLFLAVAFIYPKKVIPTQPQGEPLDLAGEEGQGELQVSVGWAGEERLRESSVVVLGETNMTDLTKDGNWFIKFYAPWCGYCVSMKSSWEDAALKMKGKVNFAEIDVTAVSDAFSLNWKIQGFPTLLLIKENKLYDFIESSLERTTSNFIQFAENPHVQPKEVPGPLTPLAVIFLYSQMHIQSVITVYQSKFGAFLVISLFGFLFGLIFGLIFLVGKSKPKPNPKSKTE